DLCKYRIDHRMPPLSVFLRTERRSTVDPSQRIATRSAATQVAEPCPRAVQARSVSPRKLKTSFTRKESPMKKLPMIIASLLAVVAATGIAAAPAPPSHQSSASERGTPDLDCKLTFSL